MAKRVPFEAAHAERIRLQPCQHEGASYADRRHYEELAKTPAFTVMDGDEVLMCAGVLQVWPGRHVCWSMLAEGIGHRMVSCVRHALRFLAEQPAGRYEMDVEVGHAEGARMAKALGFDLETPRLKSFYPNGGDGTMYVRVTS